MWGYTENNIKKQSFVYQKIKGTKTQFKKGYYINNLKKVKLWPCTKPYEGRMQIENRRNSNQDQAQRDVPQ